MEHAEKYALIPEELLSKHVPSAKQMSEFDLAMSKILNSSLADHEKVRQYYELLKRKMDLQEFNMPWNPPTKPEMKQIDESSNMNQKPEGIKQEQPEEDIKQEQPEGIKQEQADYDTFIISSVPKNMKKQAEALLNLLKSNSKTFQWNTKGVVIYNGQKLEHSNIAELFQKIFSVNKKKYVPAQDEFIQALRELGVGGSVIKNKFLLHTPNFIKQNSVKPQKKPVKKHKSPWISL